MAVGVLDVSAAVPDASTLLAEKDSVVHMHSHGPTESHYLPPTQHLFNPGSFLTGPAVKAPLDVAVDYLIGNSGELGLQAGDLSDYQVTSQYVSEHSGVTHIYLQQLHSGLDVVGAYINVNVSAVGEIINVGSSFVSESGVGLSSALPSPTLSASDALKSLSDEFGWTLDSPASVWTSDIMSFASSFADDVGTSTVLAASGVSREDIPVEMVYVPTASGGLELAWCLLVQTLDGQHAYDASVSASTGELLQLSDWMSADSYRAFEAPKESPSDGGPTLVVNPAQADASPYGWHDTNGLSGAEYTITRGNNVHAYADRNNDDVADAGSSPDGGASLVFDFPLNLTQPPLSYRDAAVTNLFYWSNFLHDVHYAYGFNEASGNFQVNNYGEGGVGNDDLRAEAQDGADVGNANNANMFTPPDGQRPRMQMYEFNLTSPRRDGDLDNGIIVHEYGHGVSNRLTGGPANSNALDAIQSGGMGEGWSDWYALMFTQQGTDTKLAAYPMGTYALGQPPNGSGIRRYPYSFDMSIDPLTYGAFNFSNEVHDSGEIWASVLWDLNWLLIDKYGFDPDFYNGNGGNNLALQLVMDGMKLQPANPSFLDGRDAILLADQLLTGGANNFEIWTAFARRGMGFSADDGGSGNATFVVEAFDLPATSQGFIQFSEEIYEVGEAVTITVGDIDLAGLGPINVQVTSSGGDVETVTLSESPTEQGIFEGTISSGASLVAPGNGFLEVARGNIISVTYNDADDGTGTPAVVTDSAEIVQFDTIYSADMDTDPGWSYQGDWSWGTPAGFGGDPSSGHTGSNVVGYNLFGTYPNYLYPVQYTTTQAMDCSDYQDVKLNFWRWLGIEHSYYDHATVEVSNDGANWTTIYNHTGGSFQENSWTEYEYDISAVAAGQSTVYIRWGMGPTDYSVVYSGWNIDDVEVSGTPSGPDIRGPRGTGHEPTAVVGAGQSSAVFHFNEAMDQFSFAVADDVVSFTGPGGVDLISEITGYSWLDANSLRVDFNPQIAVGTYTLTIGPNVLDDGPSFNPMDQNVNGINGEVGIDVYAATFEVGVQDYGDAAQGGATTLPTTLAGGNGQDGNMFSITALNTVTITNFDGHPQGNGDWYIYYKPGTHVGFETNAAAWTLVGSATGVTAQPFGTPTPIPISIDVTIPAGETYSFYVTMTNAGNVNYTNGTTVGAIFSSDANIQFLQGTGNSYAFGSVFSPRIFNGVIHYATAGGYATTAADDGARHLPVGPQLGPNRDAEADGQPSLNADGDDLNGSPDDEDGVIFLAGTLFALATGANSAATVRVDLQNPDPLSNRLDAWIDFNQDGDWDDPDEQIFTNLDLGAFSGLRELNFTIPQDFGDNVEFGDTYARFRLSTAGGLLTTGSAVDGEVEDYRVTIRDTPGPSSISGQKWSDVDGDGFKDVGELGLEGWTIYLDINNDGQRVTNFSVEPDDYDAGTLLNTIQPGITLTALGAATNEVYAGVPNGGYTSGGSLAFTRNGPFGWGGSIRLRADFATLVSSLSIDAISDDALDVGVLEAYDVNNNLLATYTTAGLAAGAVETMTISRATAEIAYVIASGAGADILNLDNLQATRIDPFAVTDLNGSYSFQGLAAGTYAVIEEQQPGWLPTNPSTGTHLVSVGPGYDLINIDFGNYPLPGSISGQKWSDFDSDGIKDPGEPGVEGFVIYLDENLNGVRDGIVDSIEPDDYSVGTVLDNIKPGVTLSTTFGGNVFAGNVSGFASTGILGLTNNFSIAWDSGLRLRVDFAIPTSFVSIDAISDDSFDLGRLEAYDSSGNLLATYDTAVLSTGQVETMLISRAAPDIAYVLVGAVGGVTRSFWTISALVPANRVMSPMPTEITRSLA